MRILKRLLSRIIVALLVITGRITRLGLSRWAGQGGSYGTVQRFFSTVIPWATLFWVCFRQHISCPEDIDLLAGDEVVVTKAGKKTHGGHDRIAVFPLSYLYTVCTGLSARMFSWPQSATLRNFSDPIKI